MKWWKGRRSTEEAEKKTGGESRYHQKDLASLAKYDCYSILGITHNSSIDEIKRAYRRLALQYHPDRNKSSEATPIFTVIQMAYDTLVDPNRKRQYDSTIPALQSTQQTAIKVVLEGAYTEEYVMDDRAAISIKDSDDAIVFENSITVPSIWIYTHTENKQYSIFTHVAFERLFRKIYQLIDPEERLNDLEVYGTPELRAHFDARFWNRGQTNLSLYCYSSMSFTIINGLPYLYLHGAKYHNVNKEITLDFYVRLRDAIKSIIFAELEGIVEPPTGILEPSTIFQPVKNVRELRLPPREICVSFASICRTKSAQAAIDMLSKIYGIPSMKTVFQHRFPINDTVCKDALAVYYADGLTAYFKAEGMSLRTILHEFYHHLVNCYGIKDLLDYQLLPDPITGYYARNEREERAANSYAEAFLKRAIG
jgi:curved DNA-binding protein CbpA